MAESLPGPSVKKKIKTSCGTIFKFSWTPSSAKAISLLLALP